VEVETVALRSLIFVIPIALVYLQRRQFERNAPAILAGILIVGQIVTIPISGMGVGWNALVRTPDRIATAIPLSPVFRPGATYRVLTYGDGKYGQYAVVRAGGRLDSEFFPEDMHRKSFKDHADYVSFLNRRDVDYVVVDHRYHKFHTNEEELLAELSSMSSANGCPDGVHIEKIDQEPTFEVFRVSRGCGSPSPPS
jgi:hypothetical protein